MQNLKGDIENSGEVEDQKSKVSQAERLATSVMFENDEWHKENVYAGAGFSTWPHRDGEKSHLSEHISKSERVTLKLMKDEL